MAAVQSSFSTCVTNLFESVNSLFQTFKSYVRPWIVPNTVKWENSVEQFQQASTETAKVTALYDMVVAGRNLEKSWGTDLKVIQEEILQSHRQLDENIQHIAEKAIFFSAIAQEEISIWDIHSPTYGADALFDKPLDKKVQMAFYALKTYLGEVDAGEKPLRAAQDIVIASANTLPNQNTVVFIERINGCNGSHEEGYDLLINI